MVPGGGFGSHVDDDFFTGSAAVGCSVIELLLVTTAHFYLRGKRGKQYTCKK